MCNKPTQCVNFFKTGLVLLKTYISPSCPAKILNLILDIIFVFYCSLSPRSCIPPPLHCWVSNKKSKPKVNILDVVDSSKCIFLKG